MPAFATDDQAGPVVFSTVTRKSDIATKTLHKSSTIYKAPVIVIRIIILQKNLEASLRLSTHYKHNNYIKQWTSYSKNICQIEVSHVLDFLSDMLTQQLIV